MPKQYTDAEKAAYYKKKLAQAKKNGGGMTYTPKKKTYVPKRKTTVSKAPRAKGPGSLSKAGSGIGAGIGSTFGPLGSAVGSFLGGKLGHLIETVTGFGDYKVSSNSIMVGGMTPPQVVNSVNNGGVIIRHREYLGDIPATVDFSIQSFLIQPGLSETFPWLSQMANSFEQYKLRGMLFEFQSTSSDAVLSTATSSALGTVVMMTEYDVADSIPTSKRQMLNAEFSCSSKPSCSFIHPIECARSQSQLDMLYTRGTLTVPAGFDQRLYDFARFHIATEGMQAASGVCGELWVTYEIELFKPQFYFYALADHFRMTTITQANPLGVSSSSVNIAAGATLGGTVDATNYYFPSIISDGVYYYSYTVVGGGAANVISASVTFTNCAAYDLIDNDAFSYAFAPNPAVASNQNTSIIAGAVKITGQNAKITWSTAGTYPAATNSGDLFVIRLPDTLGPVPS